MTTSSRYPTPPLGEELGRFYAHRSVLRRTVPLFSVSWSDFIRYLKGEGAMAPEDPAQTHSDHDSHHHPRQPRRPAHAL